MTDNVTRVEFDDFLVELTATIDGIASWSEAISNAIKSMGICTECAALVDRNAEEAHREWHLLVSESFLAILGAMSPNPAGSEETDDPEVD